MNYLKKKFIVDKELQFKIIFLFIMSGLSICAISFVGIYYFISQFNEQVLYNTPIPEDILFKIQAAWKTGFIVMVLTMVCNLVFIWLSALYFSNRIAGPIFNIKRSIDLFLGGQTENRIRTRKTDYFFDLVTKLNELFEKVSIKQTSIEPPDSTNK